MKVYLYVCVLSSEAGKQAKGLFCPANFLILACSCNLELSREGVASVPSVPERFLEYHRC